VVSETVFIRKQGRTVQAEAADRATVRKEMEARLWADFAKQFPATASLFASIATTRA